jgi:hypothetical protein
MPPFILVVQSLEPKSVTYCDYLECMLVQIIVELTFSDYIVCIIFSKRYTSQKNGLNQPNI